MPRSYRMTVEPEYNLNDDMHVKFFGVESNALIESSALTVVEVHSNIHLQDKFVKLEGYVVLIGITKKLYAIKDEETNGLPRGRKI